MEQQGADRKASRFIGIRLNAHGQENLRVILAAGAAETITDAIHLGLSCAADKVKGL